MEMFYCVSMFLERGLFELYQHIMQTPKVQYSHYLDDTPGYICKQNKMEQEVSLGFEMQVLISGGGREWEHVFMFGSQCVMFKLSILS